MTKWIVVSLLVLFLALAGCSLFKGDTSLEKGLAAKPPVAPVTRQAEKAISWLPYIVALCVLGLGASAALLVAGSKIGIALAVGSGTSLVASVVLSQWLVPIAIIGGLIALLGLGLLVWRIWSQRNTLKVQDLGLIELVSTVETAKNYLSAASKKIMFGGKDEDGYRGEAGKIQSLSTQAIVAKARGKG